MYGKCEKCGKPENLEQWKDTWLCKLCILDARFQDRRKNDINKSSSENRSHNQSVPESKNAHIQKTNNLNTNKYISSARAVLNLMSKTEKFVLKIVFIAMILCFSYYFISDGSRIVYNIFENITVIDALGVIAYIIMGVFFVFQCLYTTYEEATGFFSAICRFIINFFKWIILIIPVAVVFSFIMWFIKDPGTAYVITFFILIVCVICFADKHKGEDNDEDDDTWLNMLREANREEEIRKLNSSINNLKDKRGNIKTRNTLLDEITGDTLSTSELKHNQRYYDKLSDEINDLEKQKDQIKNS